MAVIAVLPAPKGAGFDKRYGMTEATRVLTQEALADVDAGRVIDHQVVQAWAESLGVDRQHDGAQVSVDIASISALIVAADDATPEH
ncbi:protein of unknown function [Sterolibacterium denitrificans]|uniref:Uncharacterized protein n=2 Tax=Sterolibacterium denitrificans TaxID=157592 RepID=A0A7Z7HRH9_9PROT|nr:protein of unknown function [Sterolibacterium denitrificans]